MSLVIQVFGHHESTGQAQTLDLIMVLDKLLRQKSTTYICIVQNSVSN